MPTFFNSPPYILELSCLVSMGLLSPSYYIYRKTKFDHLNFFIDKFVLDYIIQLFKKEGKTLKTLINQGIGEGETSNRLKRFCRPKRIILWRLTIISTKDLDYSTYFMYFCIAVL